MNKPSFGRAAQKVCETIHGLLILGLVFGPMFAARSGPRSKDMTFFQFLLEPLAVVLIIIALGVINFLVAELIGKLFPDPTPGPPGPIKPKPLFPPWVIAGFVLIGVIMTLYHLSHLKNAPVSLNFLRPSGDHQVYFYRDADGDGRGNPEEWILAKRKEGPPPGYTVVAGDCYDHDPNK